MRTMDWGILTYVDVVEVLEDIICRMDIVPDVSLMIRNYVETLRRDVMDELLKPLVDSNSSWGNDQVYCFWMGSREGVV